MPLHNVSPNDIKVLLVEDDEDARALLEVGVRRMGYDCRTARDGVEAWEMHQTERADIIVSDWQMPGIDGPELCRRTRTAEASDGHYTYFIFMTSFADKAHFLRGMEAGADDYHAKPIDLDELRARLASAARVIQLHRQLEEQNALLRKDSQTSFREARVDALTQARNRLSLEEDLNVLWARAVRYGHRYSIAMCDVDLFKQFNDRHGHLAGDEVLRKLARSIGARLRESDALYRYGGEEFVVLLPEQSLAEATLAMERVRATIAEERGGVTISVGVAELDLSIDGSSEAWLARADAALYRAKAHGRNRVETDRPIVCAVGAQQPHA